MVKTIICNLTMQQEEASVGYLSCDKALGTCPQPIIYPINFFLTAKLQHDDEVSIILLAKEDPEKRYLQAQKQFEKEFRDYCSGQCKSVSIELFLVPFDETIETHNELIAKIIDSIIPGTEIYTDITYGAKDLPIILFATLSFAMRHLDCLIEYILYRQVYFVNGRPTEPKLFNLAQLLHLTSLINTIKCDDQESAKKMIDMILKMSS